MEDSGLGLLVFQLQSWGRGDNGDRSDTTTTDTADQPRVRKKIESYKEPWYSHIGTYINKMNTYTFVYEYIYKNIAHVIYMPAYTYNVV